MSTKLISEKTAHKTIFKKVYNTISIRIMSPERVLELFHGEVTSPETLDYRTLRPEPDGLFCERIFGPIKNYQCACGKYKRKSFEGVICDRCGVEVTESKVRRERFGHIKLAIPIVHIWFYKGAQSKLSVLLDIPYKQLEEIVFYQAYVVINPGSVEKIKIGKREIEIKKGSIIDEETYQEIINNLNEEDKSNRFIALTGGEAVLELIRNLDIESLRYELKEEIKRLTQEKSSKEKINEALKRLKVINEFYEGMKKGIKPEWVVMTHLPVLPPDLRPMFQLNDGRFASSELNDLYRRVVIRNNRLKKLIDAKAPKILLVHAKRMLQESVDCLLDNSKSMTPSLRGSTARPLKSLADTIKGKYGRFRLNLLGKRVDYSGRSVIVVGPELKMHEVGLPRDMALELFKPLVIRGLIEKGYTGFYRVAKKMIEDKTPEVWEVLEEVVKGRPVLLNRAPTLHRPSIQAFYPKLIPHKAIQLHPLTCAAFNADFDGDQMAVHVLLSNEAILEAKLLMLSPYSIFSPANGAPIALPSQDMVLGLYYLTKPVPFKEPTLYFSSYKEVILAWENGKIGLNEWIFFRAPFYDENGNVQYEWIKTTVGRCIFNYYLPEGISFVNDTLTKKHFKDLVEKIYEKNGLVITTKFLDDIKELGFYIAYKGGFSFNLNDIIVPPEKKSIIEEAQKKTQEYMEQYLNGFITDEERYNKTVDEWQHATLEVMKLLKKYMSEDKDGFNPIYMMWNSGARGNEEQILQIGGMRGVLTKIQKSKQVTGRETIETPILSNFKEGLTVHEYFLSTYGARKGLIDTALKTADAGYLTRRLVSIASDVIVTMEDCGTLRGITVKALTKDEDIIEPLSERVLWRVPLNDIINPLTGEVIIKEGELITPQKAKLLEELPIEEIEIRSPLTCDAPEGVCAKCCGADLTTHKLHAIGDPVGIIAAQSIGEPGTQLTLRTFHTGGLSTKFFVSELTAKYDGIVILEDVKTVPSPEDPSLKIVCRRMGTLKIVSPTTGTQLFKFNIPYASTLYVESGTEVKKGQLLCKWDPYNTYIITEESGIVEFKDIIEDITYVEEVDETTGLREKVIIENRERKKELIPRIAIIDPQSKKEKISYHLPVGAHIQVENEKPIKAGMVLAKIPKIIRKIGDITGGLPRVNELFEARNPIDAAIISEIDGIVSFGATIKTTKEVIVTSKTGEKRVYYIPLTKHIIVYEGDYVEAGTPLTDGPISPQDILNVLGPQKLQEYLVTEILNVYRSQGVKINSKHVEIIVSQMMKMVEITDSGDSDFLPGEYVSKNEFFEECNRIANCKVVDDPGDSLKYKKGSLITVFQWREENSSLIKRGKKPMKVRDAIAPTSRPIILGITKASMHSDSWLSAAAFQNTPQVLIDAMIRGKKDELKGVKENVIVGKLIPSGTGFKTFRDVQVYSLDEYDNLLRNQIPASSQISETQQELTSKINE